jgi:hypothetical protein
VLLSLRFTATMRTRKTIGNENDVLVVGTTRDDPSPTVGEDTDANLYPRYDVTWDPGAATYSSRLSNLIQRDEYVSHHGSCGRARPTEHTHLQT